MRKTAAAFLFVFILLGLGAAAQADTMTSLTINGYNLTQGVNVTLYGSNLGTKYGAEFYGRVNFSSGSYQDVVAYCVDLYDGIGTGTYTGYGYNAPTSSAGAQQAAWLLGHYAPGLGNPYSPNSLSTTITALQVAIWEVSFDTSTTSYASNAISAGNFIASSLDSAVASLANQYLTALNGAIAGSSTGNTGLAFSGVVRSGSGLAPNGQTQTGGNQDLVVGNTPEPASLVLFGSAAGLMGWLRRRRALAR